MYRKKWQNLQSSTVVLSISNMEHHWAKLPAVNKSFLWAQAVAFHVRFPRADQKGHLELPEMVPGDVYRIPPRNHWAKYHGFLEMFFEFMIMIDPVPSLSTCSSLSSTSMACGILRSATCAHALRWSGAIQLKWISPTKMTTKWTGAFHHWTLAFNHQQVG